MLGDRKYRLVSIKVIEVYGKSPQFTETNCVCVCVDPSGRASSRPLIGAAERLIRLLGTFEFTGIQLGRVMGTDN